jgi:hypothetical protein
LGLAVLVDLHQLVVLAEILLLDLLLQLLQQAAVAVASIPDHLILMA